MRCVACPAQTKPNEDFTGCDCLPGFKRVASPAQVKRLAAMSATAKAEMPKDYFVGDFLPTCEGCPAGTAPSRDKLSCLECSGSSVKLNSGLQYPELKGQCECAKDGFLSISATAFSCSPCPNPGTFRGPLTAPIYECKACEIEGMGYDPATPASRARTKGWDCVCGTQ